MSERSPLLKKEEEAEKANYGSQEELVINQEPEIKESLWGWLVVLACFVNVAVLDGICYTFGMFMEVLRDDMGGGRISVAAIGSIQVAIYFFVGPLAGRLVDRVGCRPTCMAGAAIAAAGLFISSFSQSIPWLMFSYSVLGGFGFGLMYLPSVVAPSQHFSKRRALATGIAVCGTGIGMFVIPPFVEYLLESHGWRGAFRALSGVVFACMLCGALMFESEFKETQEESRLVSLSLVDEEEEEACLGKFLSFCLGPGLLKSPNLPVFFFIMLGDFLATMSMYIPYSLLPEMAESRGVSVEDAAYLISAAGLSSTAGRVFAGWLCDQGWLHPVSITFIATFGAAIQAVLLTRCTVYWMFVLFSSLFGFLTGVWVACETPLIIRTLRLDLLTSAFGLLTFNGGVAALTGPPLAGLSVDMSADDKSIAFYMTGGIMAASAAAYLVAIVTNKYRGRKSVQNHEYRNL